MHLVALTDGVGRLEEDGSVAVLDVPYPGLAELLASGDPLTSCRKAPARDRMPYGEKLTSAAGPASAVWGIGLNYRSKQLATGRDLPEHPTLFLKAPGALDGDRVPLPAQAPDCVDYEGEIAVVVGSHLIDATPQAASEAVVGVMAANDVTARDVMRRTGTPALAKSFPGFAQLGATLADPDELGGYEHIGLQTTVNGDVRQQDTGGGMIMPVGELLALISRYALLRPGDVVLTGTPAGTGDERGCYLAPDDVVQVTVGDLPALKSFVVDTNGRAK